MKIVFMTFCGFSVKVYPSTCIKYRSSEKVGLDYNLFRLNIILMLQLDYLKFTSLFLTVKDQ